MTFGSLVYALLFLCFATRQGAVPHNLAPRPNVQLSRAMIKSIEELNYVDVALYQRASMAVK